MKPFNMMITKKLLNKNKKPLQKSYKKLHFGENYTQVFPVRQEE